MIPLYVLFTALGAQFFYIIVNWLFFRRKEYVYYSLYIILITVYFLNRYLGDENGNIHIGLLEFSKLYPDRILCVLSYIFYFKFGRRFIEAQTRYPAIDRLMIVAEKVLFVYIGLDVLLMYFTGYTKIAGWVFLPVNLSIFIVLVLVFKAMIKKNEVLDRFILSGSMFFAISAFITLWLGHNKPPLDNDHFLPLHIGAIVEMIFLNAGLVYKSKMLQQQTLRAQTQLITQYEENNELMMRIATIRERISRDLHDDVGATLSTIKAYSEILIANPKNPLIAKLISTNSSEMIESLELLAWSTNPEHDHFRSLKNMMLKFAVPLCHAKGIDFSVQSETVDDEIQMPGETRQNTFLIFKESINNMVKYSEASSCQTIIHVSSGELIVKICDNGNGFDGTIKGTGSGLTNMQKRAEDMHAKFKIESDKLKGTEVILSLPYPFKLPDASNKTTEILDIHR